MDSRMDGLMDKWMDRWIDGQMDGWMLLILFKMTDLPKGHNQLGDWFLFFWIIEDSSWMD